MALDPELTRLPPQELEAEQMALGACLIEPQQTISSAYLRPDDFYKTGHRRIFQAMQQLRDRGMDVDVVTLAAELGDAKEVEGLGGAASYLAQLLSQTPTAANFRSHERLIIQAAQRRAVLRACSDAQLQAYDLKDADRIIADAITKLNAIRRHEGDEIVAQRDMILRGYEGIERRADIQRQMPDSISGIPTGFRDLDVFLDGLHAQYYVIGGRPSMGKTALTEGIMGNAAKAG